MDENSKEWRPSKKQEKFLSLPDTIFEALYGGAAGGGKTEVLMMLPLVRGFINHPRFKGVILRRTFPELDKEVIPRSMEYYKPAGGNYNDQKKCWTFPSGARIFFGHIENESDVRKYDTTEWNYIAFDELTSFTEFQYIYLSASRCRTSSPDLPAIVRSGTNPGNIGHGWTKRHFQIDKVPSLTIIKDKLTDNLRIFVPALLSDNPYIDPEYGNRLELLPDSEKRAKKFGDWNAYEGQVFEDFRIEPLPGEPLTAQHVIPQKEIPSWYPVILAIDWGFRAMIYAMWGAITPSGQLIIFREYSRKKTLIREWASDLNRLSQSDNLVDIVIDPSAKQKRGDEKTIFEQVYESFSPQLGSLLHTADNDRIGGKLLCQEFLRWKVRPPKFEAREGYNQEFANYILRTSGIDAYKKYQDYFKGDDVKEILPRLQIMETCPILIETIPQCTYEKNSENGKSKEDVAEFDGDDPYDTWRYLLKGVDNYTNSVSREFTKRAARAGIIERFEESGDINALYMNMRKHELGERSVRSRRYHSANLA